MVSAYSILLGGNVNDARVDAYVAGAAGFAQPILNRLRGLMHTACPEIEESIKWSRPFFSSGGAIVANMAAFKSHCSFGLWGPGMSAILRGDGADEDGGSGSLSRIKSVEDLPADEVILESVKMALVMAAESRTTVVAVVRPRAKKMPKEQMLVPSDLQAELGKVHGADGHFAALSPSCKREYVEWIEGAKRAETRAKRIAEAVGTIAEGKRRNWRYEAG